MKRRTALAALVLSLVAASHMALANPAEVAGIWRYKDRGVWIYITPDGRAFQCRIDKDETTTYTSEGKVIGDQIHWNEIWGQNRFEVAGRALYVETSNRRLEFSKTDNPMSELCKNPLSSLPK